MAQMIYVCPQCRNSDQIYDVSSILCRYGPIEFDDNGDPMPDSYDQSTMLWDTVAFEYYCCFKCDETFPRPEEVEDEKGVPDVSVP